MNAAHPDTEFITLERVEIALEPLVWDFAIERRAEIDRHFAALRRDRPELWNGRVLLLSRYSVENGVLRGACFETDFASFNAWRNWAFPDPGVFNIFAAAALRSADGAYVLGEMAPRTAGAGQIYFPCGTPEPEDIVGSGALDLDGNLRRELLEETGLAVAELTAEPRWSFSRDRGFVALMKRLSSPLSAEALRTRILRHLARDKAPEFCDIHIVRGPADLDPRMPGFLISFLEREWLP